MATQHDLPLVELIFSGEFPLPPGSLEIRFPVDRARISIAGALTVPNDNPDDWCINLNGYPDSAPEKGWQVDNTGTLQSGTILAENPA